MHYRELAATILVMLFVCSVPSSAADTSIYGEQWLSWSNDTRSSYVLGYLWGFGRGFAQGCRVGEEIYSGKPKGLPGEKCVARAPKDSKSLEQYAEIITNYYRSYPADRNVPIPKLLDGLQREPNLTIEQMHEYFSSSARKTQEAR
jgi:hypothetical protein